MTTINFHYPYTATNERLRNTGGHLIVVRYILNQTKTAWIQVFLGNPLMCPVSVGDLTRPERGVFYIFIVYIISKSALILSSILRASNHHYNKGPLKVKFIRCKIKHSRILLLAVLQSILLRWVIIIVLIYIISRYTWRGKYAAVVNWPTMILLFLSCFILNCHRTFFPHRYQIYYFWVYSTTNFCSSQRNI